MHVIASKNRKELLAAIGLIVASSIFLGSFLLLYPPVYISLKSKIPDGCISSDQAYSIAIAHIREYAKENNRFTTGISIEFWNSSKDDFGVRGNSSLSYPIWIVRGQFSKPLFSSEPSWGGYPNGVFGYAVIIWADNGQISYKGPEGFM